MGKGVIRIGLDSNVFRNRKFLSWLRDIGGLKIHISIIVFVETLIWYLKLGLSRNDFIDDLTKLGVEIVDLNESIASRVAETAIKHGDEFPFRFHARDYIIGVTSIVMEATLITYNRRHFKWLDQYGVKVYTPEEFILEYIYH